MAQGRAIRRLVVLYHNLEHLIAENDRRYEFRSSVESTTEYALIFLVKIIILILWYRQDRAQRGYVECSRVLPWLHERLGDLEHEDMEDMLKKASISITRLRAAC